MFSQVQRNFLCRLPHISTRKPVHCLRFTNRRLSMSTNGINGQTSVEERRAKLFEEMQVNVLTEDPLNDNERARKEVSRNFVCESSNNIHFGGKGLTNVYSSGHTDWYVAKMTYSQSAHNMQWTTFSSDTRDAGVRSASNSW